ncbi:MAG: hypothetical protein RL711_1579 [Bacteroidota bacterium]
MAILALLGCKEDLVKKPDLLIEKSKMMDIMYDLALLEAIKYQNPAVLDSNQIRPKQFIYKKYKIDSLQLAQNNKYYAADYKSYKVMFESLVKRIENEKKRVNAVIKLEEKKKKIRIAQLKKKKQLAKKSKDSITVVKTKKDDSFLRYLN